MKLSLKKFSKKQYIISGVLVIALATGGVVAALDQPQQTGADTSPLTTEVDRQGQELANHEARITNTENDVKNLQNNTNTAPSDNHVDVPAVSSTTQVVTSTPSAPAPAQSAPDVAAPTPITVTSVSLSMNLSGDTHCVLSYSDGSQGTAAVDTQGDCKSYMGQAK